MRLVVTFIAVGSIVFFFIYSFTISPDKPSSEEVIEIPIGVRGAIRGMGKAIKHAKHLAVDHEKRRKADEIGEREAMGDFSHSPGGEHYVEENIDVDALTPLAYVQHFVRSHCGPDIGFVLKCTIYNEGERDLSELTVQVRTSSHTLDTVDYAGGQYESHDIKLEGPFPAGESVTETVDMPDRKAQWVSDRTTVIHAAW